MDALHRSRRFITSTHWSARLLRILVIVTFAAVALRDIAKAQTPSSFEWPKTNFEKTAVDMDEIMSGGPPRDGIPPIDDPVFVSVEAASKWVDSREPVVVVVMGEDARAYPIQILTWHEIVNDIVGGVPVSVTFCPLCNAAIAFDRRLDGRVLDFGTTGRLRKSDLIMYDRQTESWWQQISGRAIVGDLLGSSLGRVEAQLVAFEDFAAAHGDGRVLSRDTGHGRPYGRNPYAGYDDIDNHPFLFSDPVDPRLPAMERVLNISIGEVHRLYPFSRLEGRPALNDEVAGVPVAVFSQPGTLSALDTATITEARTVPSATAWKRELDGRVLRFEHDGSSIVDTETGSRWNLLGQAIEGSLTGRRLDPAPGGVHFAFAWLAFNPESDIYTP